MLPHFVEVHHPQEAFEGLLGWQGAALTLGAVVFARVAVAPYHIWRRSERHNEQLENIIRAVSPDRSMLFETTSLQKLSRLADGSLEIGRIVFLFRNAGQKMLRYNTSPPNP
jgi:hypothetical protein